MKINIESIERGTLAADAEVRAHFAALTIPSLRCSANLNGDCELNSQDFFDFLTCFFTAPGSCFP